MATIMENDMIEGSAPLGPEDLKKLSELPRYQINREQARVWAHKDIKFLTYDDTDLRENGYDSDDEEGMLNLAMKISQDLPAGEGRAKDGKETKRKHSEIEETQAEASTSRPIGHDEPNSCRFCSFVPEFPHSWRPRKFRLVQPRIVSDTEGELPGGDHICRHYVAISYCWPVPQKDEHGKAILTPGTYQVRELDGTVRPNRCLDDVLDRAVDLAVSCGIRLIWIDQECLPQPNEESPQEDKDYQELGLQAMDIVYNRATVTAGLLNAEITSQREIDAINSLMSFGVDKSGRGIRWEGPGLAPRTVDFQLLNHVLNFLEKTSSDRWYTRCWAAQESLSAGNGLMVVLRRGPGLSYRSHFKFRELYRPPPSSRDLNKRIQSNNVAIPVEDFHRLIQAAKFFLQRDFTLVGSTLVRYGHEHMSYLHAEPILHAAEALHPAAPNPRTLAEKMFIVSGNSYGPRQTVNAAGALTLLRTRECRDVQDRVAIVANMCDFEHRLDTRALGKNCKSLRLAIIALTVLNGDYSLLAPEAYALERCDEENHNMTSQPIMRWLWPLNLVPHLIDYCQVRAGGYVSASIYNYNKPLTTDGLRLGAYLWRVDDTVDFTPIQFEWAERWNSLKCLKVEMMNIEGETLEEFNERRRQVVDHFSRKDVLHEQIRNAPNLGHNPVEERSDDSTFRLVTYVDAFRIEGNPAAQRLVADIIFAILRYLFHNADSEPRAIALANSIWHSVRVDAISKDSEDELPDDIGDWLFCHPVVVDNPYALLQLDKNRESSFSQLWFIERIMRDGCLWVGHMANSHERAEFENSPEREPADLECSGPSDAKGKAPADHDGTDSAPASSPSHPDRKPETILRRQLIRKTLAMLVGVSSFSQNGDNGVVLDRRNMAAFADLLGHQSGSRKNRGRLERDLVSAFDVDGPCLLAVPYNGEWEMLPRPGFRGMSICWVVEGVSHKDKEDRREDNSGGQLDSDSQMKWPVEGNVLDEEGWISSMEAGTSAEQPKLSVSESSSVANASSQEKRREENPEPSYRVVNKVQGLWQIMLDVPMQKYTFI